MDDVTAYARRLLTGAGAARRRPRRIALPDFSKWGAVERKPMSGVRRTTAHRLTQAWNTVPHVFQHDRADITAVEALRKRLSKKAEAEGRAPITITAFLMKVLAAALKKFPQLNSSVDLASRRDHLQAVRAHRRGGRYRSWTARPGHSRRRSERHLSDCRRNRAGGRESAKPQALARRHAGRFDHDLEPGQAWAAGPLRRSSTGPRWRSSAWRARVWSRSTATASSYRGS